MEERFRISMLLDYYNLLLTEKQRDIMDLYYNDDLSLSEISEITETSRQAIHDVLKRCCNLLEDYECKLKLLQKNIERNNKKEQVLKEINTISDNLSDNKNIFESINKIKLYINDIV